MIIIFFLLYIAANIYWLIIFSLLGYTIKAWSIGVFGVFLIWFLILHPILKKLKHL